MEWDTYKVIIAILFVILVSSVLGYLYVYVFFDKLEYRRAKKEVFAFVKSYKSRCTGNNRFEVTVASLQDSFREYDTNIINKVWLELIRERVIEQDPQDQVWCIR
jgi:hypothetical protein